MEQSQSRKCHERRAISGSGFTSLPLRPETDAKQDQREANIRVNQTVDEGRPRYFGQFSVIADKIMAATRSSDGGHPAKGQGYKGEHYEIEDSDREYDSEEFWRLL
jgi:hypothetical protein